MFVYNNGSLNIHSVEKEQYKTIINLPRILRFGDFCSYHFDNVLFLSDTSYKIFLTAFLV